MSTISARPDPSNPQSSEESKRQEEQFRNAIARDSAKANYLQWLKSLDRLTPTEQNAAVHSIEKVVASTPDRWLALRKWGSALGKLQRYDEAESKLKEALELEPKQASTHWIWGGVLLARGCLADAVAHFGEAILLDPLRAKYREWFKALDELPTPDRDKALSSVFQALENRRESASAYIAWADSLAGHHSYSEAIEKYEIGSKLAPENPDIYLGWGVALSHQGLFSQAEARFRQAILLGPQASLAYEQWLDVLDKLSLKERVSASESLESEIAGPHALDIYLGFAQALQAKDRYEQAVARYKLAQSLDATKVSDCAACYQQWGNSLAGRHEYHQAIERFRAAAHLSQESAADAYSAWGDALANLGRLRDAGHRYRQSLRVDKGQGEVYERWGKILYLQGEHEEAADKFQDAIGAYHTLPLFRQWLHNVARLAPDQQRKFAEQLTTVLDGKETVEERAEAYSLWGQALSERGRYQEASTKYQKSVEVNPKSADTHMAWGDTLLDQEKFDAALKQYESAYDLRKEENGQEEVFKYKAALVSIARGLHQEAVITLLPLQVSDAVGKGNVHVALGDCYYALTQFEEAESQYRQALDTLPGDETFTALQAWRSSFQRLAPGRQKESFESTAAVVDASADNSLRMNWALTLVDLDRPDEALALILRLLDEKSEDQADAHYQLANVLAGRRRYEEAHAHFEQCLELNPDFPYAYNNIAYYQGKLGKYAKARETWEETLRCYERRLPDAVRDADPYPFFYCASVMMDVFAQFEEAESVLKEGLEVVPRSVESLILLGQNSLGRPVKDPAGRASSEADAREYFRQAERLLAARRQDSSTWGLLGDLLRQSKRYDEAEKYLRKAAVTDSSPQLDTQLGVLFSQKNDFKQAVKYFEKAVRSDPDDLDSRSNLAEGLFKLSNLDGAREEYARILQTTEDHVDTRIGLGQVFTRLADSGDVDLYEAAIDHLGKAVKLGELKIGSKLLSNADLAATYYALGYARVRLYEKSKAFSDEDQLTLALENFTRCRDLDPMHYKSRRAVEKLTKRTRLLSPESMFERLGPRLIFLLSVLVFLATQIGYWLKRPYWLNHAIDSKLYSAMTLSSLALAIVGLYLPRILKLKVAGIEIEKSSVEQISKISQPLNIS